ncbi:MAG TPA: hypothetical protein VFP84_03030 [Kofleriaceae bacterium]|nr:hypothetical protein [Kofleriaceae bacterium]
MDRDGTSSIEIAGEHRFQPSRINHVLADRIHSGSYPIGTFAGTRSAHPVNVGALENQSSFQPRSSGLRSS